MNRDELFSRLENSMMSIGKEMSHELVGFAGCSPAQNHVLMIVGVYGPIGVKQLAQHLRVTSGAVTQHIDALEKAGLLIRKTNPNSRREVVVEMTPHGTETFQTIRTTKAKMLRQLFIELSDEEIKTLVELIEKVSGKYANNERRIHEKV